MSVATVSRVFNDSGPVSNDTRQRIREVAERLHYAPHGVARSLITSRTNTLGALLPALTGELFSEIIRGMDQTARKTGYHLLVASTLDTKTEIEAAIRAMRGRVDGLIAMSPHLDTPSLVANVPLTLPVVLLNTPMVGHDYNALTIENRDGAREMVSHLLGLGHRRVAIITGGSSSYDAAERLLGYRSAMREGGIDVPNEWELAGDLTEASGYRAVASLLEIIPRPTAIFAANDAMAIGAMSALREAGLRVPDDIAVAGFDNVPLAPYMNPPLTSMHVAVAELGAKAVEILVHAVNHNGEHERQLHRIGATLVIRDSCGARLKRDGLPMPNDAERRA